MAVPGIAPIVIAARTTREGWAAGRAVARPDPSRGKRPPRSRRRRTACDDSVGDGVGGEVELGRELGLRPRNDTDFEAKDATAERHKDHIDDNSPGDRRLGEGRAGARATVRVRDRVGRILQRLALRLRPAVRHRGGEERSRERDGPVCRIRRQPVHHRRRHAAGTRGRRGARRGGRGRNPALSAAHIFPRRRRRRRTCDGAAEDARRSVGPRASAELHGESSVRAAGGRVWGDRARGRGSWSGGDGALWHARRASEAGLMRANGGPGGG